MVMKKENSLKKEQDFQKIIKAKKSGRKCIGCPDGATCKLKNIRENLKEAQKCCCNNKDDKL